jgi:hypothetical protein
MGCLCALAFGIAGCARPINREAERRIRRALPDLIGPARQYRVRVENDPIRTLRGRLSNVTVHGDDVEMPNGLLLDHLYLEIKGIEVDTGKSRVKKIGETRFVATVGAANLDEFLAGASPPGESIRKVRVTLGDNQVTLAGEREALKLNVPFTGGQAIRVKVPFQIIGPLRVAGPRRMEIDPTRITVIGIPISGFPLSFIKDRFENAIDLNALPFPVELGAVQTASGRLILSGTADVQAILDKHQGKR